MLTTILFSVFLIGTSSAQSGGSQTFKCGQEIQKHLHPQSGGQYMFTESSVIEANDQSVTVYSDRGSSVVSNGVNCSRTENRKNIHSKMAELLGHLQFGDCPSGARSSSCMTSIHNQKVDLYFACAGLQNSAINAALEKMGLNENSMRGGHLVGPSTRTSQ